MVYVYLVERVKVLLSQFEWKSRDSPTETRLTDRYISLSFVTPANFPHAVTVQRCVCVCVCVFVLSVCVCVRVCVKERVELFVMGDSVRPGILVLVNNTDWELTGQLDYCLQQNDHITFISTLHGG